MVRVLTLHSKLAISDFVFKLLTMFPPYSTCQFWRLRGMRWQHNNMTFTTPSPSTFPFVVAREFEMNTNDVCAPANRHLRYMFVANINALSTACLRVISSLLGLRLETVRVAVVASAGTGVAVVCVPLPHPLTLSKHRRPCLGHPGWSCVASIILICFVQAG